MVKSYLKYVLAAKGAHSLHSPFVYEFYTEVIKKSSHLNDGSIRELRKALSRDTEEISLLDLGAGSKKKGANRRRISEIVRTASVPTKYGRLLSRMVDFYGIKSSIELGTSLGIGTSYLAMGSSENKVVTIEGDPSLHQRAEQNFDRLKLRNIRTICGSFDDHLEESLSNGDPTDLVYIDGNHTYEATMDYFHFYLEHTHEDSFLIFDDIHWSEEMEKAWREIVRSPSIHVSMDLFRFGIVCKKKGQAKQHFVLRF